MDYLTMEKKIFLVENNEEGSRLDQFLAVRGRPFSRSYWQKNCRRGNVFIDGRVEKKTATRLKADQKVEVFIPPPQIMEAEPEEIPLNIVYEDGDLLVINKPKGMVVHPAVGHPKGTLVNALLAHCSDLSSIGDKIRPGIIHRLDKDTSGLLMVAKNEGAFRQLSDQLKRREVTREYRAIVHSQPPSAKGTIDAPLGRDPRDRKRFAVRKDGKGREAVTHYELLLRVASFSLLSLRLETGRTHQIRVHLAFLGCPVAGDPLYGPKKSPYGELGQYLHARTLGFVHPTSGEYMEFVAEPGKEFFLFLNGGEH
jgi:23S rRNA pseudouridine1911/1915/1917 synthase